MQLPRGTLAKNNRGPATLASVTEPIATESLTGYLRVSIFSDNASECVVVYLTGKPVMAFVTDAGGERPDPGMRGIAAAIQQADAIIEVCTLGEKQVSLLRELYGNLGYVEPRPQPPAVETPPPRAPPAAARASPARPAQERPADRPSVRFVMPEIRGRFVRSEEVGDLRDYAALHPDDTGHLLYVVTQNGPQKEYHAIIVEGRLEIVYDDREIWTEVPASVEGVAGLAEFYAVDPLVLKSVIQRSLKNIHPGRQEPSVPAAARFETPVAVPPRAQPQAPPSVPQRLASQPAPQAERPEPTRAASPAEPAERPRAIGIPARDILGKSRTTEAAHVGDDISKTLDEISKSMDDDVAMVRKVEQDFASHVDELLEKLDLSHLRKGRHHK